MGDSSRQRMVFAGTRKVGCTFRDGQEAKSSWRVDYDGVYVQEAYKNPF